MTPHFNTWSALLPLLRKRGQVAALALTVRVTLSVTVSVTVSALLGVSPAAAAPSTELPPRLSDTGLYTPGSTQQVRAGVLSFSPQYPLWSDAAEKRRWIALPAGKSIDASRPDAWVFPPGTRFWKEFSHDGKAVETRYIERRADGSWRFATYVWAEDGRDALLAPEPGIAALPVATAPGGRYAVPGRADCLACHGGATVPVLGFGALQLSPDRDPMAAHGRPPQAGDVNLRDLVLRGALRGLPNSMLKQPPRIVAESAVARAALGYLHANCSHCHHSSGGQVPVRLTLAQSAADPLRSQAAVLASAVNAPSRYQPPGEGGVARVVVPGNADASVLATRMHSRQPRAQMPPLGTQVPDPEGLALIHRWINHHLTTKKDSPP